MNNFEYLSILYADEKRDIEIILTQEKNSYYIVIYGRDDVESRYFTSLEDALSWLVDFMQSEPEPEEDSTND